MEVLDSNQASATVVVAGTAEQINNAFGIELKNYESPLHIPRDKVRQRAREETSSRTSTQHHRGFEGQVHLPPELQEVVTAVFGLDNRILGGINGSGDPPGAANLSVPAIATAYNFPTSGAAGQTIGIFNGGGNYDPADITAYIAGLPAGYRTGPTLREIDLTVDGTTYTNDKTKVSSPSNQDYEITQDIETAATVAQGAMI
jgi:kumamolisin